MKIKGFDKFQHYYLDRIGQKIHNGDDVPAILDMYFNIGERGLNLGAEERAQSFADTAHGKLSAYRAKDPANGSWRTWGFVNPLIGQVEEELMDHDRNLEMTQRLLDVVVGTTGILLCVEKRERVLPSSSLADKVWERVQQFEEREGRSATKKDWAILKDEVTAVELTKAPIKRSRIWVLLWENDCYVFTSSQKAAEETNAMIRMAFGSWPTIPAYVSEDALQRFFRDVMLRSKETRGHFIPGDKAVLMNSEKEKITVVDSDLDEPRYIDLLNAEHFKPTELLFMFYQDEPVKHKVWAKMNKKGDVKAFSLASVEEEGDDGGDDMKQQRERGSAGYDSRVAEIWMLMQGLVAFSAGMYEANVCLPRTELGTVADGDALSEQAKPKDGGKEKAAPEEERDTDLEDDGGAWEDTEEHAEVMNPIEEHDDTFDMPDDL
jgi:DNA recombination-dependent growth factor C